MDRNRFFQETLHQRGVLVTTIKNFWQL